MEKITTKQKQQIIKEGANSDMMNRAIAMLTEAVEPITPMNVRQYICSIAIEQYNLQNHPNPNHYTEYTGRLGAIMRQK